MKYRYLLGRLSLIIAMLGCNLLSGAPSIGEAGSLLTNTPAQPVDAPLPLITPLPTDSQAQPPVPTASEVQPPASQQPAPQQPQPNPPTGCSGTPNISFTASRTTITVGESTTLSWTVTNSDARQIDNGVGNDVQASDSRNVSPGEGRTTYTLTARCGNNTTTKEVTVNVDGVGAANPADPAIPAEPTNFTAAGSQTKINFNWTYNSTNITGFEIFQDGVTNPVLLPSASVRSAQLNLQCNFSGKFYIVAVNSAGSSANNSMVTIVTVPCKPTSFTAAGSGTTINFTWIDNSANETGFVIYSQSGAAPLQRPANSVSFASTGRPCNTGDNFEVRAYNVAGESASDTYEAVTIPCAPTDFSTTATRLFPRSVSVMFTDHATNESGFHVYVISGSGDTLLSPSLAAKSLTGVTSGDVSTGVLCGTTYSFVVHAYNSAGESAPSNVDNAAISC